MVRQKLKVAAAGLGRMGRRHALNFLNRAPRAELVAAFTPDPAEMEWAKQHLEPFGVTLYDDYDKMIAQPGLNAVVIGTATSVHAEEAIKAMERNLHVLCEKPLSTDIEIVSADPAMLSFQLWHGSSCAYDFVINTVQVCCGSSQEETSPEGDVWFLSPFRRVVSRRIQEGRPRLDRPAMHNPKSNLRQA